MFGPTNARMLRERKDGRAVTTQALNKAGIPTAEADGARTYSDVVASRPPTPEASSAKGIDSVSQNGVNKASIHDEPIPADESLMSKLTSLPGSDDYNSNEWTTVSHRRRASFPSVRELRGSGPKISFAAPRKPGLTVDQGITVQAAEQRLTGEERQRIQKRDAEMAKADAHGRESSRGSTDPLISFTEDYAPSSRGEGPSTNKGKGPDVRNWGAAGIPLEDIDLEEQRRAFEMWGGLKTSQDCEGSSKHAQSEHKSSVKEWIGKTSVTFEAPRSNSPTNSSSSATTKARKTRRKSKGKSPVASRVKSEAFSPAAPPKNKEVPPSVLDGKRSATPYSATMKQAVSKAVSAGKGVPRTPQPIPGPAARPKACSEWIYQPGVGGSGRTAVRIVFQLELLRYTWADVKYNAEIIERVETLEFPGKKGGYNEGARGHGGGNGENGGHSGKNKSDGFKKKDRFSKKNDDGAGPSNPNKGGNSNGKNDSNQNGNHQNKGSGHTKQHGIKPSGSGPSKPPLSDSKRAELKAAGLCFNCRLSGHTQNNCPTKKGKSGLRSNKAGFDLDDSVPYQHVDGATETIETMSLGAIRFDLLDERAAQMGQCDCRPHDTRDSIIQGIWDRMMRVLREAPPNRAGDLFARGIETVLTLGMPYPGEVGIHDFESEGTRFAVCQVVGEKFLIMDVSRDSEILVDADLIRDPHFNLPSWYATQMAELLEDSACWTWDKPEIIGDALALGLQTILESGIGTYPGNGEGVLEARFLVARDESEDFGAEFYAIWDHQNNWCARVAVTDLTNPNLDIVNWYRTFCTRSLPTREPVSLSDESLEWSRPAAATAVRVGDIYAEALHRAFNAFPRNYPGDSDYLGWYDGSDRFEVMRVSEAEYGILDSHRGFVERISVDAVRNEFMRPGDEPLHRWYANLCADRAEVARPVIMPGSGYDELFGDQLLEIIAQRLADSGPDIVYYGDPMENIELPDGRFSVWGTDVWGVCSVVDHLRCAEFKLRHRYEKRERKYGRFFDGFDRFDEQDRYYKCRYHPGYEGEYLRDLAPEFDPDSDGENASCSADSDFTEAPTIESSHDKCIGQRLGA
ncbi:hypothetical protein DFH09DRAFT_1077728 [Mycena vulgaris]|nr:hypothetical protein DFH09DRAFT_1077728 [Mycena vulgaris]